jgi:acyl-CoA synthetase (AMP-forming)/AMP-acid ligase II
MEPLLLHDVIRVAAVRLPNRVAVSHGDRRYTFAEVEERSRHLAMVLAGRGVRRGDRVGWWADTSIEAGPFYYGLAQLGAVFVPLNPRFSADEAQAVLDLVDPRFVVTDDNHTGDVTIAELLAERPKGGVDLPEVHETDADVIFCTSGTTGTPKGAVLSHRSNRLRTVALGAAPTGPSMSIFPQFHWGGWSFVHSAWYSGDEIVLVDAGDTEGLLQAIDRRKVQKFYAIPAIWKRILTTDRSRYDLSSLRQANTGTSATPLELRTAVSEAFPGATTTIGYGATEAGGLCTLAAEDLFRKAGSVGLPAPGVLVRIEEGELWVRSPQMFSGYFRNPEATAAAVVDGWYRTGDLVERDDEGYVWVVGRVKDMIRTGGETVAPSEVDVVLQRHPAVADGAAAGIPDDDWGEIVAAFVVLRPGQTLDLAEVRRHCEGTLANFKHPRRLYLVDAIPRTGPTGQVQRRRLTERAQAADAATTETGGRLEFA